MQIEGAVGFIAILLAIAIWNLFSINVKLGNIEKTIERLSENLPYLVSSVRDKI